MIIIKLDDDGQQLNYDVFTPKIGPDGSVESINVTDQYVAHQLDVKFSDRPDEAPLTGVFFALKPKEETDG